MQQVVTQQPGVTVVTQNAPTTDDDKFSPSALSQMRGLSITQIVMGGLCILFGIVLIALEPERIDGDYAYIGYGIWIGFYFILVGGIGLGAVSSNTGCWIISAMVLNIICSSFFWFTLLVFSSIGLGITNAMRCYWAFFCTSSSLHSTFLALDSLMIVMAFAELIVTIWSAVLCCGAVCSCCKTRQTGAVIHYNARPAMQTHQVVMYPSVPAATTYGVYATGPQVAVHGQYSAYPAAAPQQPAGGFAAQPQGPPSYYNANQNPDPQNSGYEQPPPTALPNDPQHPTKH